MNRRSYPCAASLLGALVSAACATAPASPFSNDMVVENAPGSPDGGVDASSPPSGHARCGGDLCRADQTCTAARCTFPCSGAKVPGDHATLKDAVQALDQTGGTICLQAQVYDETVIVTGVAGKALTIIGPNAKAAAVHSLVVMPGYDSVTLRGFNSFFGATYRTSTVANLALTAVSGVVVVTAYAGSGAEPQIAIEGADLDGVAAGLGLSDRFPWGLAIIGQKNTSPRVTLTNTYFHDTDAAISVEGSTPGPTLDVANCTFVGNGYGIHVVDGMSYLSYANNIFLRQTVAAVSFAHPPAQLAHGYSLLFGNATNYEGLATHGLGDLNVDALLDADTPPRPLAHSPALHSSLASRAPALDFWGLARSGGADRGAVQSTNYEAQGTEPEHVKSYGR